MSIPPFQHFATDAIHAGQPPDPRTGAVIVPISLATTFYQESPGKFAVIRSFLKRLSLLLLMINQRHMSTVEPITQLDKHTKSVLQN